MIDYNIDTITDTLYSDDAHGWGYTLNCVFDYISGKAYVTYVSLYQVELMFPVSLYQVELIFSICLYMR